MISLALKKYRYTFFFPSHEFKLLAYTTPENMLCDFDEGLTIEIEGNYNKKYFIDLSKVYMIECDDNPEFKDLPKVENE